MIFNLKAPGLSTIPFTKSNVFCVAFVSRNSINNSVCLNNSKLHFDKKGTEQLYAIRQIDTSFYSYFERT